jgi:hypothetical protein
LEEGSQSVLMCPWSAWVNVIANRHQTQRGWGLFLIQNMVDEVRVSGNPDHHTIELVVRLEGGEDAS